MALDLIWNWFTQTSCV